MPAFTSGLAAELRGAVGGAVGLSELQEEVQPDSDEEGEEDKKGKEPEVDSLASCHSLDPGPVLQPPLLPATASSAHCFHGPHTASSMRGPHSLPPPCVAHTHSLLHV